MKLKKEIKKYLWIIILIIVLISIDQSIKEVIKYNNINILNIEYNDIDTPKSTLSNIISDFIVVAMVSRFMIVQRDKMYKTTQISLGLILAGGTSNLIDRIFRGRIIDYFNIQAMIPNFPIFNLADIFIIIGFIIFVIIVGINTFGFINGKEKTM